MKKSILITLDAGHGGKDPGAVGPNGTKEKDVVLNVVNYTAEILQDHGVGVHLTRSTDKKLGLKQRASLANAKRSDLFVSVHCNSAEKAAQGIETFVARGSTVSPPYAESVQDALTSAFPSLDDRGVRRANFTVLTKTAMPAILAELAFIHTVEGEKHLASDSNQYLYATALANGILKSFGIPLPTTPVIPSDPEEPVAHLPVGLADIIKEHTAAIDAAVDQYS